MTRKSKFIILWSCLAVLILTPAVYFATRYLTYSRARTVVLKMMPDSSVYTGGYQRRMKEGNGELVYPDSSVYRGSFHQDKRSGYGKMVSFSGETYEGYWENDRRNGKGTLDDGSFKYTGLWSDDTLSEGSIESPEFRYEGPMKDFLPEGFGIIRYTNGQTYIGNFENGYKNGLGRLVLPDRTFQFGKWEKGILKRARDKAFNDGDYIYGIDISHHQPEIDWDQLTLYADQDGKIFYRKAAGRYSYPVPVSFVIMKATEKDDYQDPEYQRNADLADKHHIVKGAYHFYRYGVDPEAQMKNFIQNSRYDDGDLPPVLDIEIRIDQVLSIGKETVQKDIKACLDIIERERGVKPIIYSGKSYYDSYVNCDLLSGYDLWIARYGSAETGVNSHVIWQYTSKGQLGGMDPTEDIDIDIFNGDVKAWNRYLDKVTRKKF